jgi:GH15 family glucan-1,4-alpha-glucosidase
VTQPLYPAIGDYGFIADCHSAALISRAGSIDWCCLPRFDSKSCFGRLLGWRNAGYCQIAPAGNYRATRRYLDDTLVLETTFTTDDGEVHLQDCFTMRSGGGQDPHRQILRMVAGVRGTVRMTAAVMPRFDYGALKPWIRRIEEGVFLALAGSDGLVFSGNLPLEMRQRHDLAGEFSVAEGDRLWLSIFWRPPEVLDSGQIRVPEIAELERRLGETLDWWRSWVGRGHFETPFAEHVRRSAVVLRGLVNAPTGAITAAPTTSLPEAPGGSRNWDYRFSWIRDSAFTVRSLGELGFGSEADGFRRFVERSAAGNAAQLQILFGVGGEHRLAEFEMKELEGYGGAAPVRIGNAAESQLQLDAFGELLDLSWRWHARGHSPDEDYWEFLVELVKFTAAHWNQPDCGIWEFRGNPQHFVLSKAMCWRALDRGIALAQELERRAPIEEWRRVRGQIEEAVAERGYDARRGVFTQAFGSRTLDASLLLLPTVGFVAYDDERMVRTTQAIREDLEEDGLLRRYTRESDGLAGEEGVFLACTFWLVECLARQRRLEEARRVLRRALDTGNDLLLFSEEFDPRSGQMLGNFPQGLTHLSLIAAAVALGEEEHDAERLQNR